MKVRASEFRGLTGNLSPFELFGAAALAVAVGVFAIGVIWRVLT